MATVFDDLTRHPVAAAVAAAETDLDQVAGFGFASMTRTEIADTLAALHRLHAKVAALELGILPTAETHEVGTEAGATDTAAWWANQTRQNKRDTKRRIQLAALLDVDHQPVRDAMAAGHVSEEQAAVIVRGVEVIPVEHRSAAAAHLIALASEHDPVALRRLAARILEVVAPDIAEDHERKALERQEALAEEACRFTISDDGHGLCHGRFTLPSPVGAMLKQSVLAMNAPKHRHHTGTPKGLGHAFCEYVTRYPTTHLPQAGGVDATVVVTMTMENLLGTSQAPALLDTGDRITAGQARQLACEARIIPMVLGGRSEILDQGRATRFHTKAQRIAIGHRDRHCTADGCDWPAALCHVHHNTPWSRGGKTTVNDGRLLCPRHHGYAHSPKYEMKTVPNGRVVFSRS